MTKLQWIYVLIGLVVVVSMVIPMLNFVSLIIPNASVLLFPSWFQTGREGPHGIEATGQRLIFMLGQLLVFVLALSKLQYLLTSRLVGSEVAFPSLHGP